MKVSIITATYNSAATVADTLRSVAAQTHPDIEHLIIDGLSKDDTLTQVAAFPHVARVISEPDKGIYDAMNKGIAAATGEIIGILNSDDFYTDSAVIAEVVEQMTTTGAMALYADLQYVAADDTTQATRTWTSGAYRPSQFKWGWMPPHPTFFVRRELYEQYGHFNLALRSAADYELMLRFLYKEGVTPTYLPRITVKMRAGGMSNASWKHRLRANREDRQAWEINQLRPYFFTTYLKPLRKLTQFITK